MFHNKFSIIMDFLFLEIKSVGPGSVGPRKPETEQHCLFHVHTVWIIVVIFGSFIWNAREGLIWWWWLVKNASQAIEKASKVCRVCPPPSTPSKPPCPEGKSAGERWVLLVLLMDTKSQMESPFQELFFDFNISRESGGSIQMQHSPNTLPKWQH